ncbi:methyltransferase-like protein 22, partial [Asbolus verrucosus]
MDDEDYTVSSELYQEYDYTSSSKPTVNKANAVSKFKFKHPPPPAKTDSDGDFIVSRKKSANKKVGIIEIDVDKGGLLQLIESNILRNKHLTKHPITVLELDFTSQVLPREIVATLAKIPIVIAADVIYDDVITEAFVRTVAHVLSKPPKRSVYIALEKRYVFTIADCDAVAPCYEYYMECLQKLENVHMEEVPLNFPQYFHYERVKEL